MKIDKDGDNQKGNSSKLINSFYEKFFYHFLWFLHFLGLPNIWPNFIGHIIVKPFLCVLYCGLPSLALSPVTSDSLPERCNPLSETISKSAQRKWKLQLKKVPIRKREFTFWSRDKRDFFNSHNFKSRKKVDKCTHWWGHNKFKNWKWDWFSGNKWETYRKSWKWHRK